MTMNSEHACLVEWYALVYPLGAYQKLVIWNGEKTVLHQDFQDGLKHQAFMKEAEHVFWDIQDEVEEVLQYRIYHSIEELRADTGQAIARLDAFFEKYFKPTIAKELRAYAAAYTINLPPYK